MAGKAKPAMTKPAMPKGCSAFDSKLITEVRNGDEIKIFSESYTADRSDQHAAASSGPAGSRDGI